MDEKKLLTLGFLIKDGQVWLAVKKRKIGEGRLNGYGGGKKPADKNLIETLKREVLEESTVTISEEGLEKVAIIDFHNESVMAKVHIYLIKNWEGEPQETAEMGKPEKLDIRNLPYEKMMPADKEWLPLVLAGKKIIAEYYYGPFQKELIREGKVKEITNFPKENPTEFKIH